MTFDYLPLHVTAGITFASDFFYRHIGTKYDEETMADPLARLEMDRLQRIFLQERYPKIFPSGKTPVKGTAQLGIGVATIPKIFGCKIKFEDHLNPTAIQLLHDNTDPMTLHEPDYERGMQWLYDEIDKFQAAGYHKSALKLPDLQGELNIACKLVGDNRLLKLIAQPKKEAVVRHILDIATNSYIKINQLLRKATGQPLISTFHVAGCSYFYISPQQWTKYLLPQIKKLEVLGVNRDLHHCGLADTAKIEALTQYPWRAIELGFGSDLKRARELTYHQEIGPIPFSCRISPYRMLNQNAIQITRDVEYILANAKGGPVSIKVVGCPYGTSDENLYALLAAVENYNKQKEAEEDT